MKLIAVLPTGEWAEVESDNDVCFVTLTDKQFNHLSNEGASANTILELTAGCTKENINDILGLTN